jgi:hypothetical protein
MAPLSLMIADGDPVPHGWGAAGLPICYMPGSPVFSKEDAPWGECEPGARGYRDRHHRRRDSTASVSNLSFSPSMLWVKEAMA